MRTLLTNNKQNDPDTLHTYQAPGFLPGLSLLYHSVQLGLSRLLPTPAMADRFAFVLTSELWCRIERKNFEIDPTPMPIASVSGNWEWDVPLDSPTLMSRDRCKLNDLGTHVFK